MNGTFRRLKALIIKESFQIFRDPSCILIAFVLPMILMFIYGYGVSLDLDHLRIGLVMEDTGPDAQSFAQSLTDSRYYDVKIVRDRRELYEDILAGNIRGFVVIPSYFSQYLLNPDKIAPIQVITDGSEPNTANFVQNYVESTWSIWLQQRELTSDLKGLDLIRLVPRIWYNEDLFSRYFLLPGSLGIIMSVIGTLLTALVVAREWERGTMEALMATPIKITEIVFGKLIPYYFLGMGSMILCVIITTTVFHVPYRGSILALFLVSSCFLFAALAIGLFISTVSKNQFVASQAAITASFLPALILSGFIFEISSMPPIIQIVTYIMPARYFVSSMKTLFLVGDVWPVLLFDMACIMAIATVFYFLTSLKTVKRLE